VTAVVHVTGGVNPAGDLPITVGRESTKDVKPLEPFGGAAERDLRIDTHRRAAGG